MEAESDSVKIGECLRQSNENERISTKSEDFGRGRG
ncbi:uncharacterized protein G2W53_023992 [Senna tora]|uniref:Uncharacterized protein n=1 Tax=Senna tora TaxID=362788 RepID=A0A834TCQ9_9FABA|nr:uncharacterized protein G2W53_023992 [Senna tora]